MPLPDLNLLIALDALLDQGSVAAAARRLGLSPSATSRALARLRDVTGDPLLVRAGRGLVPTPRAEALRTEVHALLQAARAVLSPAEALDLTRLTRTFTLRSREGFVETFGPALIARVAAQAPGVRLHFAPKPDKDSVGLREGHVDLETGVLGQDTGPELRSHALFRDRLIGVVQPGHPLSSGTPDAARFAAGRHILIARRSQQHGPIDTALAALGLHRQIATQVDSFAAALALARATDLIATVPERQTAALRGGLSSFALPLALPPFTVALIWHPRQDADPGHRWLRDTLRAVCAAPA